MGILSDFIVATPEQIAAAFPAWLAVAEEPVTREANEPFTGEVVTLKEWAPAVEPTADLDSEDTSGDYTDLPHTMLKSILHLELMDLAQSVCGLDADQVLDALERPALLDPSLSQECGLHAIPAEFLACLADLPESEFAAAGAKWAGCEDIAMKKITAEDCEFVLKEIVPLAQQARETGANLYLWWSL